MPDLPDPYAGQGGSYIQQPDGTKVLEFRTDMKLPTPAKDFAPADDSTVSTSKPARKV